MFDQLREYQKDIVEQVLNTDGNTLIQLPTGGGKTKIAKHIAFDLINHKKQQVLFMAPKNVLMDQTLDEFGKSAYKLHASNTLDSQKKSYPFDKYPLLISTNQTASRRNNVNSDVIIIDEIHYGYDGIMIEKLIKDKPNTRIIGLSATPYDKSGRLLKGFDLVLNKYDMKYMIQHGYLVPLRSYALIRLVLDNVKVVAGDYDLNQLGKVVCDENTILEIVQTTKEYIEQSKKTIVFAVNIEHANLLAKAYEKVGFVAKSVHSKIGNDDSSKIINDFRNGYNNLKILVSVLKLTTGFDVPDTDCAVIARPTKSQNLYKQMVGRILRISPGKKEAILLDCGNVMRELGMPLDPIIVNDKPAQEQTKMACSGCGSTNLSLKKEENSVFWLCRDCGLKKYIDKKDYKCLYCRRPFNEESKIIIKDNGFYLHCECGNDTLISEIHGDEKLIEIIDNNKILKVIENPSEIIDVLFEGLRQSIEESNQAARIRDKDKVAKDKPIWFDEILIPYYKDFLNSSIYNDVSKLKTILDDVTAKLNITTNIFFMQSITWSIFKGGKGGNIKEDILKKANETKKFDTVEYFLDIKLLDINNVISDLVKFEYLNLLKYIFERYNIKFLNFYLEVEDYYDIEIESKYQIIKNKSIEFCCKYIESIDVGKCFSLSNLIDDNIVEDDHTDNELIMLYAYIVDLVMTLSNYFLQKNIKVYVYGKEISCNFVGFKQAKIKVHQLNIKSLQAWYNYIKEDSNRDLSIPRYPNLVYKEWKGWIDWLDSNLADPIENIQFINNNHFDTSNMVDDQLAIVIVSMNKTKGDNIKTDHNQYLPFEEARKIIQRKNFQSKQEWWQFTKSKDFPINIPDRPHEFYIKNGWINMNDWLGINATNKINNNKVNTKQKDFNSKDPKAYYDRGNSYAKSKNYELAIKDYTKAIKLNLKYIDAYKSRANLYIKLKDYRSATKDARKACNLGDCELLYNLEKNGYVRD